MRSRHGSESCSKLHFPDMRSQYGMMPPYFTFQPKTKLSVAVVAPFHVEPELSTDLPCGPGILKNLCHLPAYVGAVGAAGELLSAAGEGEDG